MGILSANVMTEFRTKELPFGSLVFQDGTLVVVSCPKCGKCSSGDWVGYNSKRRSIEKFECNNDKCDYSGSLEGCIWKNV